MAQSLTAKQQNWLTRFSPAVVALLDANDDLVDLCNEYSTDAYGTGGANAIVDATVQTVLPATTALLVAEAVGSLNGTNQIQSTVAANRGYLEMMRP